jgi:hypothetical protein
MDSTITNTDDLLSVKQNLKTKEWLIACLCAAWCDTCQAYRNGFDELRIKHPEKCFAWIDIEDHAELIDDLEIENFPTIAIQYNEKLLFLGTMLPDVNLVHRLVLAFEDNIRTSGIGSITPSIQDNDYPLPENWSLRAAILQVN